MQSSLILSQHCLRFPSRTRSRQRILVLMFRPTKSLSDRSFPGSTILIVSFRAADPAECFTGHDAKSKRRHAHRVGDMQLLDVAVLPWPPRETGLLMGWVQPRVSNRDFQERRAGGLAGRPGIGSRLQGRTLAGGRFYSPGSDFFRLHVAQPPTSEHARVSANSGDSSLARLVFAIRGGDLGVWLASSFANCIAPESWARRRDSSSRFAATQFLCHGTVDSVSTICANRTQTGVNFGLTVAFPEFSKW